jgi:uncharacterized protein YcbK (DUF882 family)
VPFGTARQNILRLHAARAGYSCGLALCVFLFGSKALQNAVAEGDTRTITMHHLHTGEDITITYKRDGRYDDAALEKLNWFLRDWRRSEQTRMDPQLIDLVWEVQRETGTKQPIDVVCGYRSPQTNAMLRRRSRGVARFSQHMLGHAMDFYIPGVPLEQLREIGLRLQRGGVGFYPTSGSPFVHMDTGGVRMWPRMSRNELLRVFPDGRTAYVPSDGRPLPGYELALADIKKRGQNIPPVVLADVTQSNVNPLANLFGFMKPAEQQPEPDEDDEIETASTSAPAGPAVHYFPSSSGPAQTAAPAQKVAAAALPQAPATPAPPAATPAPPPAPQVDANKAANPLLAALEREAARKRATIGLYAAVPATAPAPAAPAATANTTAQQPATYQLASYEQRPVGQTPQRLAALTPNQVIAARGYWAGLPDGEAAAQPAQQQKNPPRAGVPNAARKEVAAPAANASTGGAARRVAAADSPWASAHEDHVPPDLALAYAAQPEQDNAGAPFPAVTRTSVISRAAIAPAVQVVHLPAPPPATTIAVKRTATQAVSTILTAPSHRAAEIRGARFDNPWLRAVMLSPSVRRYLITLLLGDPDYRALSALMEKPTSSVMVTFAAEPNPGLTADRFSGSAVVFISTVTYGTHTASLQ